MQEHTLRVQRTARYLTLGPLDRPVRQLWIACHGYGQLARAFAERLGALDDGERLVVVPEGLSRFYHGGTAGAVGASWMTREAREDEIRDYVGWLDALRAHLDRTVQRAPGCTTHVLGFSQGAATAARWAAYGAAAPDHVILWAGDVPPDLDWARAAPRFGNLRLTLVLGTRDQYGSETFLDRQCAALADRGLAPEVVRFDGGHRLDDATLRGLAA